MTPYEYLILPDLHNRIETHERIISVCPAKRVVHLGDYWDNWDDTPADAQLTAEWVKTRIDADDILLLGNHDVYYVFGNAQAMCSGNTYDKRKAILKVLPEEDLGAFQLHEMLDVPLESKNILVTHAGLSQQMVKSMTVWDKAIHKTLLEAFGELRNGKLPDLACQVGARRGGRWAHGGVLWEDSRDFSPVSGLQQLFGHTPSSNPRTWLDSNDGEVANWCIDTHSQHFATVDSKGDIQIHATLDWV